MPIILIWWFYGSIKFNAHNFNITLTSTAQAVIFMPKIERKIKMWFDVFLAIELIAEDEEFRLVRESSTKHRWKYFDNYYISNYGRVYSRHKNGMLMPKITKQGRVQYKLYEYGKRRYFFAHRLVALAFVENPDYDNLIVINHLDENPLNNKWDNLEWTTHKHNVNYGTAQKRKALKLSKKITQFDQDMFFLAEYVSLNEASRQTRIPLSTIFIDCRDGSCKTSFYWQYS